MNYRDNTYHFRQDSTFLYYFGLDQPSLAGVVDADSGESLLFGDELSIDMIVWMGVLPSLASREQEGRSFPLGLSFTTQSMQLVMGRSSFK